MTSVGPRTLHGIARSVRPVLEPAGRGEVAPVDLEAIEPGAPKPVLLPADPLRIGGERQIAVGWIARRKPLDAEVQQVMIALPANGVAPVLLERVGDHPCQRVVERVGGGVGKVELEKGCGDAGILFVQGNEGIEGLQPHLSGEGGAQKVEFRQRELAAEGDRLEVRHPVRYSRGGPNPKDRYLGPSRVPLKDVARSPWRTRASTNSPVTDSALMAKCENPLVLPLLGRLKISQSISRPFPARPMQPVPNPPRGKLI